MFSERDADGGSFELDDQARDLEEGGDGLDDLVYRKTETETRMWLTPRTTMGPC